MREIIESCTPLSDTKEITINLTNNHHGEIFAWIDPENFEKIMLNLINNAIKFAPVGGEIDIDISQYDDEHKIRITVQDNGIGIQQDDIEKMPARCWSFRSKPAERIRFAYIWHISVTRCSATSFTAETAL